MDESPGGRNPLYESQDLDVLECSQRLSCEIEALALIPESDPIIAGCRQPSVEESVNSEGEPDQSLPAEILVAAEEDTEQCHLAEIPSATTSVSRDHLSGNPKSFVMARLDPNVSVGKRPRESYSGLARARKVAAIGCGAKPIQRLNTSIQGTASWLSMRTSNSGGIDGVQTWFPELVSTFQIQPTDIEPIYVEDDRIRNDAFWGGDEAQGPPCSKEKTALLMKQEDEALARLSKVLRYQPNVAEMGIQTTASPYVEEKETETLAEETRKRRAFL